MKPIEDRGGYVIAEHRGELVELHQFCATMAGACRGCKKRYAKQTLVFRIGEEHHASQDLPTWCFSCSRPPRGFEMAPTNADEMTLHEVLALLGWRSTDRHNAIGQGRHVYDAAGSDLGDMTAGEVWTKLRELGLWPRPESTT